MTTQTKEVSNITKLKPNTWYKLIDKEGWLTSDLENSEIYENIFDREYDTVRLPYVDEFGDGNTCLGHVVGDGEYVIIATDEYRYFTEVQDKKGTPLADERGKDSVETLSQRSKVIVSDKEESSLESHTEDTSTQKREPTTMDIHYTKEMYGEGVIPEKGMLVWYEDLGEYVTLIEVIFALRRNGGLDVCLTGMLDNVRCNQFLSKMEFPEPDLMEEERKELEAVLQNTGFGSTEDVMAKAAQEYYHKKYNLEGK